MNVKTTFVLLLLLSGLALPGALPTAQAGPERLGLESQSFDRSAYYRIMESGDLEAVNGELTLLSEASFPEKEGYEGALLMRKAGLLAKPGEKLRSFKAGRIELETALLKDSANAEYHFLRLIIQEHAPGIVRYSKDREKDSRIIRLAFKGLAPAVQKAIFDYSKKSKILHPEDFDPNKK